MHGWLTSPVISKTLLSERGMSFSHHLRFGNADILKSTLPHSPPHQPLTSPWIELVLILAHLYFSVIRYDGHWLELASSLRTHKLFLAHPAQPFFSGLVFSRSSQELSLFEPLPEVALNLCLVINSSRSFKNCSLSKCPVLLFICQF